VGDEKLCYGVFGGTFDPPHLGHVLACLWALESGAVDRVMVIPVGRHPFGKKSDASFEHRMEMCRLAVRRLGGDVIISDIEGRRQGTSYMVETLEILHRENPGASFRLLAGSDVAKDLPKWKRADRVMELAPLLEIPRPLPGERFDQRPGALPPISSTEVREALSSGDSVELFLSKSVRDYIGAQQLYRNSERN